MNETVVIDGHVWKLFTRREFANGCRDPQCTDPHCPGTEQVIASGHTMAVYAVYRSDLGLLCLHCAHCQGRVGCWRVAEDLQ